jgi:hypothetical protein
MTRRPNQDIPDSIGRERTDGYETCTVQAKCRIIYVRYAADVHTDTSNQTTTIHMRSSQGLGAVAGVRPPTDGLPHSQSEREFPFRILAAHLLLTLHLTVGELSSIIR